MKLVFEDQTFSYELLRTIGYAPYGGADIGECLATAYRIAEGDFESWYTEWYSTAERVREHALQSEEKGNIISAKTFNLKASNYYRTAEFFLHGDPSDPRILDTWKKSQNTFLKAMENDDHMEKVKVPYEDTFLPGYFYKVDNSMRPVLLVHGGFDSTQEELYFEIVVEALNRGYHCMTFEGPGQGAVIREQHMPFRHDWEKVVSPVIDYLFTRTEVDKDKIALMGISIGGLLATRAAAFDHRLAACIANDGLFSYQFGEMMSRHQSRASSAEQTTSTIAVEGNVDEATIQKALKQILSKMNTNVRWAIENGMFTFQANNPMELAAKTEPFTLEGVAELVKCPMLICEAEADHFFAGQPEKLYEALRCPKTYMKFTADDSAEEHCHFGALQYFNHSLFEWLNEKLHGLNTAPNNNYTVGSK